MNGRKWTRFMVACLAIAVLLGQFILGAGVAEQAAPGIQAEHQSYLPLLIRQVFVESRGELDPSFDGDGLVLTDFELNGWGEAKDVVVQPDGKIVAAGTTSYYFALARYTPDGSQDFSFDGDGKLTLEFTGEAYGNAVALQADGKILVAGFVVHDSYGIQDFALARYNPGGSLDMSFGSDGKLLTDFGYYDYAYDVALQPDGKILVAGITSLLVEGYQPVFALARYTSEGTLDTSFDKDGMLTTDFAGQDDLAYALAMQPDGKILVAGMTGVQYGENDIALARYNSDGSLDNSFGGDGMVTTDPALPIDEGLALVLQADGKIVVAGTSSGPDVDFILVRFNPDGNPDNDFGEVGLARTDWGCNEWPSGMVLQPDGKIIVAGYVQCILESSFILARYHTDGSLDESFGYYGQVLTDPSKYDMAGELALQPDGKIVLAGALSDLQTATFALLRYK